MQTTLWRPGFIALALAAGLAAAPAWAQTTSFKADLKGASEVPPVNTQASGSATATYDSASKKLSWKLNYSGLSGPATGAHFHGPAEPGKNAGVVVPITSNDGSAALTEAQAADLMAGRWYVNVHTAAHPNGEIRGQVTKGP